MEDPNKVREVLDSIGPGFCLAKWNQVSIHLGRGLTHSCYHPQAHELSEKEVLSNPSHYIIPEQRNWLGNVC